MKLERPELSISVDSLYRKYNAYRNNNLDGLIDKRGGWNKGVSTVPDPVWQIFLSFYLDENQLTVTKCYTETIEWTKEVYPEFVNDIPSERSFRRYIKSDIEKAIIEMMREGDKSFSDRCLPYIERMYDKLYANDVWVADNHTFDIQSLNDEGVIHRLHLTAFMDAKSGVLVGWNITNNPCSQSTILALRHAISRFGIPKMVYFDNGSEFLTHDVGGRGHRTRKNMVDDPPTILQRLGIEMRNALVRNAKAKPIERTFYTVKSQFSKSWSGYCGGTILERPESLKRRIKDGKLPCDYEVRDVLETWIDGDYNIQMYGGGENCYKSKTRIDVWNESIQDVGIRQATESELNLMMARSTGYQKIKRNGVFVTIAGEKIWFMHPEQTVMNLDKEVYVRFDPADLRSVRIYDKEDRYLWTWQLADILMVDYITQNKSEISDALSMQRAIKKYVKAQAKGITAGLSNEQRITALDAMQRRAFANKEKFEIKLPKNIIPVRANEPLAEEYKKAVGETLEVTIDMVKANRNAAKRLGKD